MHAPSPVSLRSLDLSREGGRGGMDARLSRAGSPVAGSDRAAAPLAAAVRAGRHLQQPGAGAARLSLRAAGPGGRVADLPGHAVLQQRLGPAARLDRQPADDGAVRAAGHRRTRHRPRPGRARARHRVRAAAQPWLRAGDQIRAVVLPAAHRLAELHHRPVDRGGARRGPVASAARRRHRGSPPPPTRRRACGCCWTRRSWALSPSRCFPTTLR